MITQDGWFDWMLRVPGPADKVYSERCTSEIILFHDAVGYLPGWYSRLFDLRRDAQGHYTPNAAASVTGWLAYKDGVQAIQHYPISASCWASGSRHLNTKGNAFENESAPQPIANWHNPPPQSDWQVECSARIIRDLSEFFDRPLSYWRRPTGSGDLTATEYEHNETVRFGGVYSSCPNKRVRWAEINARLAPTEEDDMAKFVVVTSENTLNLRALGWSPEQGYRSLVYADLLTAERGAAELVIVRLPPDVFQGAVDAAEAGGG